MFYSKFFLISVFWGLGSSLLKSNDTNIENKKFNSSVLSMCAHWWLLLGRYFYYKIIFTS